MDKVEIEAVQARVAELGKKIEGVGEELEVLASKLKLGRGTRDLTAKAKEASLASAIEEALRARPHSADELARAVNAPADRVGEALSAMSRVGTVVNVGLADVPRWFFRPGDDGPTDQLNIAVEALVRDRPMTFQELMAATGARRGRVSGAIVFLQRGAKVKIENLGTKTAARWFVVPERRRR